MAYNMRTLPEILQPPSQAPGPATKRTITPHIFQPSPAPINAETPQASKYLNNPRWIEQIDSSLVGSPTIHDVSQAMVNRADVLVPLILHRLEKLVATRVSVHKRQHWSLQWVRVNSGV